MLRCLLIDQLLCRTVRLVLERIVLPMGIGSEMPKLNTESSVMYRIVGITLLLLTAGVLASSPQLRAAAMDQLRSISQPLLDTGEATEPHFDAFYTNMVDQLPPQQRAERVLELAINRYQGSTEYIIQHAQSWRVKIKPSERLNALLAIAINAPLIEIRMAAFEIHLAQYNLGKSIQDVDYLMQRFDNDTDTTGPWAIWNMAAIGARGIDRERIFDQILTATYHHDDTLRRWSVDALAAFGGTEIISRLLDIAANDSSPIVRERAFCGLAQSGTLHIAERYEAIPGLVEITQNTILDQQTRAWAYQALREITHLYNTPDDPDRWQEQLHQVGLL